MSIIEFDRNRSIVVFRDLAQRWQNHEPPFNEVHFIPPEKKYHPAGVSHGSIEHAHFLFFGAWLNRNGSTATELFRWAKGIAEEQPWLIDPRDPRSLERERFEFLTQVIPFASHDKYRDRVDWWFRDCMGTLRDSYDCDPRNIFLTLPLTGDVMEDRHNLILRLTKFKGTGGKIAQLMCLFFQESDWLDNHEGRWQQIRRVPMIATDMWVMRLMCQLNLISHWESEISTQVSPRISEFISRMCAEENIPHTALIQALWHLGAVICGRMRPRDHLAARPFCFARCPVVEQCVGIVPPNYIANKEIPTAATKNGRPRTTQRLASIRWSEIKYHPVTFDDLWKDSNP